MDVGFNLLVFFGFFFVKMFCDFFLINKIISVDIDKYINNLG